MWCVCAAAVSLATALSAAPLTIYNTGVDVSGTAWGSGGVADIHYSLIVQPSPGGKTAVTVTDTAYPFPPWLANNSGSRWIGPGVPNQPPFDGFGPGGTYAYRTLFNVPANAVLSSVNITGDWAVDDVGANILINGVSTGQTYNSYAALAPFSVTSGFVFGTNALDFKITNANLGNNPTGLRVDHIQGSYVTVPEPAAAFLATIACLTSTATRRRTRAQPVAA
jgi:hypothetical protein